MKIRAIAVDQTRYWTDDIIKLCGRIRTVYAFNEDQVTYCCEITPSYALFPVEYLIDNEVDDDTWCRMMDCFDTEPVYWHFSVVDSRYHSIPIEQFDDYEPDEDEDIMEDVIEYVRGNSLCGYFMKEDSYAT